MVSNLPGSSLCHYSCCDRRNGLFAENPVAVLLNLKNGLTQFQLLSSPLSLLLMMKHIA